MTCSSSPSAKTTRFGRATDALDDPLHRAGDRVATGGQLRLVGGEIDDRPPRHSRGHRRFGHRDRHDMNEARIERDRNDVVAAEARPRAAIGGRHLVGNVLAREIGERVRGRDLHLHVDRLGAHVERAAEDIGKSEDVVDLVGIVGAPGGDDHVVARLLRVFRRDFRVGVRHRENDRIGRHGLDHVRRQRPLGRKTEEDIRPGHRFRERPQGRLDRVGGFPLIHAFLPAAIDDALGVAQDDVRGLEPDRLDQVETGDAGGSGAVADEARGLDVASGQMDGVDHPRGGDDRGAVLVVVKDGNVHHLAQALLDVEALRRLDVLEIDPAERRPKVFHRVDEFVRILRPDFEVDRIDVGKALEQHRLAFHHRLGRQRSEVAEAQNRRAVGDDRDHVAAHGVVVNGRRIGGDRLDRDRDARRIGERQVALGRHRLGRHDLELARAPSRVELERLLIGDRGTFAWSVGLVSHGSNPAWICESEARVPGQSATQSAALRRRGELHGCVRSVSSRRPASFARMRRAVLANRHTEGASDFWQIGKRCEPSRLLSYKDMFIWLCQRGIMT